MMGVGSDEKLYTYTIITTDSNDQLKFLHDRMPVILENGSEQIRTWLDPSRSKWSGELQSLLRPYKGELEVYPVSKDVGKVGNNSPAFIVPLSSSDNKQNIANFFGHAKGGGSQGNTKKAVAVKKEDVDPPVDALQVEHQPGEDRKTLKEEEEEEGSENNAPLPVPADAEEEEDQKSVTRQQREASDKTSGRKRKHDSDPDSKDVKSEKEEEEDNDASEERNAKAAKHAPSRSPASQAGAAPKPSSSSSSPAAAKSKRTRSATSNKDEAGDGRSGSARVLRSRNTTTGTGPRKTDAASGSKKITGFFR